MRFIHILNFDHGFAISFEHVIIRDNDAMVEYLENAITSPENFQNKPTLVLQKNKGGIFQKKIFFFKGNILKRHL